MPLRGNLARQFRAEVEFFRLIARHPATVLEGVDAYSCRQAEPSTLGRCAATRLPPVGLEAATFSSSGENWQRRLLPGVNMPLVATIFHVIGALLDDAPYSPAHVIEGVACSLQ